MRKTIFFNLGLVMLSLAFFCQAQTDNPTPAPETETQAIVVADVSLYDIEVKESTNDKFTIDFKIINREKEIQPNVKYSVELLQNSQTGQTLIDSKVYPESLVLRENEIIKKQIIYQPPAFLKGEYQFWLKAVAPSGLLLASTPAGSIELNGTGSYLQIDSSKCYLQVKEDNDVNKTYTLDEGVAVKSEETLFLSCPVKNNTAVKAEVTPFFTTYKRIALTGEVVTKAKSNQQGDFLESGEEKTIKFEIPKATESQAYDTKLTLQKNNKDISNSVIAHYVLAGKSATIQNIRLDKNYYQAGDTAEATLFYTGSADGFPDSRLGQGTSLKAISFKLDIFNDQGKACANSFNQIMNEKESNVQAFKIPITVDCKNPQVKAAIYENGKLLDQQEFQVKSRIANQEKTNQGFQNNWLVLLFLILALILTIILFIVSKKKNQGVNKGKGKKFLMFLILGLGFCFLGNVKDSQALTFTVDTNWNSTATFNVDIGEYLDYYVARYTIPGIIKKGEKYSCNPYFNPSRRFLPGAEVVVLGDGRSTACCNAQLNGIKLEVQITNPGVIKTLFSDVAYGGTGGGRYGSGEASFTAPFETGTYTAIFHGSLLAGSDWHSATGEIDYDVYQNGQCGDANGQTFASAPEKNLCATGSPSAVTPNGMLWNWDCYGINGGAKADPPCWANRLLSATADLKARKSGTTDTYSDGPITIAYNGRADLSWSSTNATKCRFTDGSFDGEPPFPTLSTSDTKNSSSLISGTTFTIECCAGTADDWTTNCSQDSVAVSVTSLPVKVPGKCGDNSKTFEANEDWDDDGCCERGTIVEGVLCRDINPIAGAEPSEWHCIHDGISSGKCSASRKEEDTNNASNWIETQIVR